MTKTFNERKRGEELLSNTPMKREGWNEQREREEAHRALPQEEQPYMVIFMGMLDYAVLWIGEPGGSEEDAKAEMQRWASEMERENFWLLPFTQNPHPGDLQVRQQWSLDSLVAAIQRSYPQPHNF